MYTFIIVNFSNSTSVYFQHAYIKNIIKFNKNINSNEEMKKTFFRLYRL